MESNNYSIFKINHDPEMIQASIIYFAVSFPSIPIYIIIMLAIYQKDFEKPNITYKLMNIINFFEFGQSICHFLTSPILLFPGFQTKFQPIVRIIGCTLNTFWIAELPVMAILAVCRILIFTEKMSTKAMSCGLKISLTISLSWIGFVLIYGWISQNFTFYPPFWSYDLDVKYAQEFADLELILSFPCLLVIYLSYVIIFILIYMRKKTTGSHLNRKSEIAIMIQYTFMTIYITLIIILWHRGDLFFDMSLNFTMIIINSLWISCCYINPLLLLILNRQIRKECFYVVGIVKRTKKKIVGTTFLQSF